MVRYTSWAVVVLFLALSLSPGTSHAVPIVIAGSATVNGGDIFTIPISITDAVALQFFQFDLSFAPLIVQASAAGATAGALLPGDWFFTSPGFVNNTGGQILGVSASGSPVSGSGVLANLTFTALTPGVSPLTLGNVFLNLSGQGFSSTNGQITVSSQAVPEPATLVLLASGLVLLAARHVASRRGGDQF